MGFWDKSKVEDADTFDIDKWLGDDDAAPYCYNCQDWIDEPTERHRDGKEVCPVCGDPFDDIAGDSWASPATAKASIAAAPAVSPSGDMWGRSSGFTWGSKKSWWQTGDGALSSMWGTSYIPYGSRIDPNAFRMKKHKEHLDRLCKVVDPTVKHTLHFASHSSGHTNMQTDKIVIDGDMLLSSDSNLDITAGLAIHEKLHLIHTKPLTAWEKKKIRDIHMMGERKLFHNIANIVEDEYIEKQLHKTCPGYVHYIEECKKHYFEKDKEEIEGVKEKSPFGDLINTLLMLVRYPSMIDADRRRRHAPHIRFFGRALSGGLENREATFTCIETLFDYLKNAFEKMHPEDEDMSDVMDKVGRKMGEMKDRFGEGGVEFTDEEWDSIRDRLIKEEGESRKGEDRMERALSTMDKLIDRLTGDGEHKELSSKLAEAIADLEDTDYTEIMLDKSIAASRSRKVSWRVSKEDEYDRERYREGAKDMKVAINKLKRKIKLYGNTEIHTIRNQKRGKLDKRMLHRIPAGRRDLFKATIVKEDKPLDICLLVDESGSMGHNTMEKARNAAIAVKEALLDNPKLNLWVFGHSADKAESGMTEMIQYWSPTMKERPMAMGGMQARYENRDGNAIIASANRVKDETDRTGNKLMIVFSDGSPSADNYRGRGAIEHTAKAVRWVESQGWSVIQVGFEGAYDKWMKMMFTNWTLVDDVSQLGDKVANIIKKVLKI